MISEEVRLATEERWKNMPERMKRILKERKAMPIPTTQKEVKNLIHVSKLTRQVSELMFMRLSGILYGYCKEDIDAFTTWAGPNRIYDGYRGYYNKLRRLEELQRFLKKSKLDKMGWIPSEHTLDRIKTTIDKQDVIKEINSRRVIKAKFPTKVPSNQLLITYNNMLSALVIYNKTFEKDKESIRMYKLLKRMPHS